MSRRGQDIAQLSSKRFLLSSCSSFRSTDLLNDSKDDIARLLPLQFDETVRVLRSNDRSRDLFLPRTHIRDKVAHDEIVTASET